VLPFDRFVWYLPEPHFIVFATRYDLLTLGPKRHRVHWLRVPHVLAEELAGAEVPESSGSVRASREQESVVCRDCDGVDPVGVPFEGPNQLSVGNSPEASNVFTVSAGQKSGEFRHDVPVREMSAIVQALDDGTFLEWFRRSDHLGGADLTRGLRTTLLNGILAGPAAPQRPRAAAPVKKRKAPARRA
jgi:hypothetical protein